MGLRQENRVEGVTMMKRQPLKRQGVSHGDRQFLKPTIYNFSDEFVGIC